MKTNILRLLSENAKLQRERDEAGEVNAKLRDIAERAICLDRTTWEYPMKRKQLRIELDRQAEPRRGQRAMNVETTSEIASNGGAHGAPAVGLQRLVREFVDARLNDCMEVMAEYPDGYFDLAICDPPYGINVGDNKSGMGRRKGDAKATYKMGDWDSQPPPAEYFAELRRVSKNQIIWGANHYIERMAWNSPCWIIWDKLYSNDVSFAAVEMAWTSFRTTAKKFECTPLQAARIHPTQKPVKLYDWLLANYAKPGQRILDTHMGSGSIGIACHYYRCPLVACEIDPDYFRAACDRVERETAQADFYLPNNSWRARNEQTNTRDG